MEEIEKFLSNKSVAIVGNARSIFDKNFGNDIDNHDVVVRFNRGFPENIESQGSKTDILILACELTKKEIEIYNPKYVINRLACYSNPTKLHFEKSYLNEISKGLNANASSGLLSIEWCLKNNVKSIDLYGFDFEKTPTYYNPEGYKTKHNYSSEEERILRYQEEGKLKIF